MEKTCGGRREPAPTACLKQYRDAYAPVVDVAAAVDDALRLADDIDRSPLERYSSVGQVCPVIELARSMSLSGYDAFYAFMAELLEMPLVTADKKLAAAVGGSLLIC